MGRLNRRSRSPRLLGVVFLLALTSLLAASRADARPPDPPALTLPDAVTEEAQGPDGATVTYSASARDWRRRPVDVTCNPPSGSRFPLGTTTVTCTATDRRGKSTSGSFRVRVRDTTAPRLSSHADVTVSATSLRGARVSYRNPRASDAVDPSPAVSCSPASGRAFPLGVTRVRCTARDDAGNTRASAFTVTVRALLTPRDGARVSSPPLLRWLRVPRATYYNVQLYRLTSKGFVKVLSAWPVTPRRPLRSAWTYDGRRYRLVSARYRWYVWPGFGKRSQSRYGRLLGKSDFVIR